MNIAYVFAIVFVTTLSETESKSLMQDVPVHNVQREERFLQELLDQMMKSYQEDVLEKPFTAKQQAWWDSLGVRHPQSENKQNVKIRKEVRQLTDLEWQAYIDAVTALNSLYPDPDDERSQYQMFTSAHKTNNAPAAHGGTAFLPWHREFLWRFERAIQLQNTEVSIPYWDTSLDRPLPDPRQTVIFSEHLFGNADGHVTSGPFAEYQVLASCLDFYDNYTHLFRNVYNNNASQAKILTFSEQKIDSALDGTHFANLSYRGSQFEADHGGVHAFVNGLMANLACSPADPIFLSHHTFIDWVFQEFRDHSQITPIETEYPTMEDINIGGDQHEAYSNMNPFPGLYNIHGLSTHYTDYYYNYAPRYYTSCVTSQDCTSQYLWCDVIMGRCVSKIRAGGVCAELDDESCYGDNFACVRGVCAEVEK